MNRVHFCAVSDVGCRRCNNEDMALAGSKFIRDDACAGELECNPATHAVFAVADGMGGHEGGEIASEIALRSLAEYIKGIPTGLDVSGLILSLKEWAGRANRSILGTAATHPQWAEMGTTLTALVVYEGKIAMVNVGDSRLYRYRNGVLKQLSTDHSERELTGDPDVPSHLIYNFLGNDDRFFADVTVWNGQVFAEDLFLLCSDGLSDMLADEEINAVLDSGCRDASMLVQQAKEAGGKDNVTVLTLLFCSA